MNFSQLTAYLQAYLETNDSAVIGQIPNFMTLAAARISTDLRSSLIERTETIDALPSQPLPDGFLAATLLRMNTNIHGFVTPTVFNALSGTSAQCYTLLSGVISINPAPVLGDVVELSYYVAGDEALSSRLPHLFLHGAAAEAELYQGNTADAQIELQLYQSDLQQANGWDIQSGPISLGGASRAVPAPFTLNTTPIQAVDVSFSPAPGVFSTNVQAAITEVQGNVGSHVGNLNNPHQTTAGQVGAIPFVAPGNAGNILASDGTEWQSVNPSIAISGVSTFNGRTGAVNPIIQDYNQWFAQTPVSVTNNSVVLFDGTDGRKQKVGPLITDLATDAELAAGLAPKANAADVAAELALKADTATVNASLALKANIDSPALTGTPTAPTAGFATDNTQIANTAFANFAVTNRAIGINQTWQNLTGSRASGVTYTNSTGKPIMVAVSTSLFTGASVTLSVGGSAITSSGLSAVAGNASSSAIVPNGATYKADIVGSVGIWAELRA